MKVLLIALTVAVIGRATSSAASGLRQKTMTTLEGGPHGGSGTIAETESTIIDVMDEIQLEDQAFWKRSLSMSTLGDSELYVLPGGGQSTCSVCE